MLRPNWHLLAVSLVSSLTAVFVGGEISATDRFYVLGGVLLYLGSAKRGLERRVF